jgi:predicted secreted protein
VHCELFALVHNTLLVQFAISTPATHPPSGEESLPAAHPVQFALSAVLQIANDPLQLLELPATTHAAHAASVNRTASHRFASASHQLTRTRTK